MDQDLILIFSFVTVWIVGVPIIRAITKRIAGGTSSRATQLPSDIAQRLERLEQIAEATQLEVERMSEGQRFTTKLLAERAAVSHPAPNAEITASKPPGSA